MTVVSDNLFPKVILVEGSAPSNPSAGDQKLFVDSVDHHLKRKNSAGTVVDLEAAASGLADEGAFTYLDAIDAAAPGNPSAGHHRIYAKSGGLYYRDSTGAEIGPLGAGGGGGATIVRPALTPATPLDDFNSVLSGWTAQSMAGSFALTNVIAQSGANGSRIWIPYSNQHGYIYRATTDVDQEWIVGDILAGPRIIQDNFFGIAILDASSNGVAIIYHYGDQSAAIISCTAGIFDGGAHTFSWSLGAEVGTSTAVWMRLTRVGNVFDAWMSVNGSVWDQHVGATISKTITASRLAIGIFGGTAFGSYSFISADWAHKV